ncbi:MAG: hypothetical protein JWN49_433 [Parcubacteria group bacterium]|nr:hypothetical protein [Parcubacteria group bacterium]
MLIVIVIVGGIYYFTSKPGAESVSQTKQNAQTQETTTTFKTYTDQETGFTFTYPSQYGVKAQSAPTSEWGSRLLLTLDDKPNIEPTSHPRGVPMTVGLQKQPVTANGKIYHTIAEYQQSGIAAQMVQGASTPNGELVTINGTQALLYHFPPSDMTGIAADDYFFINNDLIYEVGINPKDPYADKIIKSVSWK